MTRGGRQRAIGELGLLALLMGLLALLVASEAVAAPRAKLSKDLAEAVERGARARRDPAGRPGDGRGRGGASRAWRLPSG